MPRRRTFAADVFPAWSVPPASRGGKFSTCPWSCHLVRRRRGSGLPMPRRRTFAADVFSAWSVPPASRGGKFSTCPRSCHLVRRRRGSGLPMPRRRTFAAPILGFAHSDADYASPSWLRLSAYAGSRGMGSPSRRSHGEQRPYAGRQEGGLNGSGRRPAKKKSHDAMFFVKPPAEATEVAQALTEDRHPPVAAAGM